MRNFAKFTDEKREGVFQAVAAYKGLRLEVVEKDFWVCFMLDYLFNSCKYRKAFVFKGGTSLSKSYHVIERFSEDIDIILDWRKILSEDEEPWDERSKTQQNRFNKTANAKAAAFYRDELVPYLNSDFTAILGQGHWFEVDQEDEMVVNFNYPQIYESGYLREKVRLEIGPLAEWLPSHITTVEPFVAERYPQLFEKKTTDILTIDIERTFWEKLTILHKLAHFQEGKVLPRRYARHLYDVYCMANIPVKESAFARKELLERDIIFKQKFYYAKGAHYETATLSGINLTPAEHIMDDVRKDYAEMKNMIYGAYPDFEDILKCLKNLEQEVHGLQ